MPSISDIANYAATRKLTAGPDKRFRAFEFMVNNMPDDTPLHDLAILYKHFAPKPPRKPKTRFDWIAKASNAKDARYYLGYTKVNASGSAVATDGHRIHISTLGDREAGFYEANGTPVPNDADFKYPDISRVMNQAMTNDLRPVSDVAFEVYTDTLKGKPVEYLKGTFDDYEFALNKRYYDEATQGARHVRIGLAEKSNNTPVMLEIDTDRVAIIMQVRL